MNILWVLLCTVLVLLMQAGFLTLESGLTRSKNAINVAMKNATDLVLALLLWWLCAYGLMFGDSRQGWLGSSLFAPSFDATAPASAAFFLFQSMFCATAATIVSGAVAERMRFAGYQAVTVLCVVLVYPVFGHWAWGGALGGETGWLAARGFVDFAGSTVVHGTGGWVALAGILVLGARNGRFTADGPRRIPGSNLPLAMLGVLLLAVGWVGFNGGSTLTIDARVPGIVINTLLAAAAGGATGFGLAALGSKRGIDAIATPLNGIIAGLVAITAGCHAMSASSAVLVGAVGALAMASTSRLLERLRLDDAIGAVPAHLAAGVWGTVAVGLLADLDLLGTGLGRGEQVLVQLQGIAACAAWSFPCAYVSLRLLDRWRPLRVSPGQEHAGLNVTEHGARSELAELVEAMEAHARSQDLSARVPVEPFTEVGVIADQHNRLMDALENAVAQTRSIVRDMRDGLLTFDTEGHVTHVNPGAESIIGQDAQALLGLPVSRLFRASAAAGPLGEAGASDEAILAELLGCEQRRLTLGRPDGTALAIELTVSRTLQADRVFYTALLRDVTERQRIEDQLHRESERLQVTLESIADGVITAGPDGRIVYMNPVAERLTLWQLADASGQRLNRVFPVVRSPTDAPSDELVSRVLSDAQVVTDERPMLLYSRDGTVHVVKLTAAPIRGRGGTVIGVVVVFHDVTSARALERRLAHQASHDDLTGLINRREFESRVQALLEEARDIGSTHAVCYLDLDQFKVVNDSCGHEAGDNLLRQLTAVASRQLRASDTLARLGGDEFGVILRGCGTDKAVELSERLREAVREFRFSWNGRVFGVGASIGVVPVDRDTESLSKVLSMADAACYAAKDLGRNRVHVYMPDDERLAMRSGQMQWVSRIQRALDVDGFELWSQAIAPVRPDGPAGTRFEVLVRLRDSDGSLIPPGAFLPAAERYNLIQEVDRWVVDNALAWVAAHHRLPGWSIGHVGINLSGVTIGDERFLHRLVATLRERQVPPELLCFEVTETAAMADPERSVRFITELKRLGCRFALDDFGSGLSSFAYLKNLPVDLLKIDGAFIRDIDSNAIDLAMVESINRVGHVMGLETVAEFVEDEAIMERLRAIGVDYAQGYHIGRPRPLADLGATQTSGSLRGR